MKRLHIKISSFLLFLVSCARFPYTDIIRNSAKELKLKKPEAFKLLELNGENFEYVQLGNSKKPLVILIHGSPGSWTSFAHFFLDQELLENYELISFSRLGYSPNRPGVPHHSLKDQIMIPEGIIRNLSRKREIFVVGHSYGAPVAVYLAMKYPELVNGVLLAAGSVDPELEKMHWYQHIAKLWGIRSIIPDDLDVCNREILGLKDELIKMEGGYSQLKQAFYIIQGTADRLVPKENVEHLKKNLKVKKMEVDIIKGARHFLPWASPESFKRGLFFLKESKI